MSDTRHSSMGALIGFYLWRGGLMFSAVYVAWQGLARAWSFLLRVEVPAQVAAGIGLLLVGLVLLFGSLIVERVVDARSEKGLREL